MLGDHHTNKTSRSSIGLLIGIILVGSIAILFRFSNFGKPTQIIQKEFKFEVTTHIHYIRIFEYEILKKTYLNESYEIYRVSTTIKQNKMSPQHEITVYFKATEGTDELLQLIERLCKTVNTEGEGNSYNLKKLFDYKMINVNNDQEITHDNIHELYTAKEMKTMLIESQGILH